MEKRGGVFYPVFLLLVLTLFAIVLFDLMGIEKGIIGVTGQAVTDNLENVPGTAYYLITNNKSEEDYEWGSYKITKISRC